MTPTQIARILAQAPVGSNAWLAAMQAQARSERKVYQLAPAPFRKWDFL